MRIRKRGIVLSPLMFASLLQGKRRRRLKWQRRIACPVGTVPLTAELQPSLQTDIQARVPGYVQRVMVDRGSMVKRGQVVVELSAPEMESQTNAAEAAVHQAEQDESQAEAEAAASASTYGRLAEAAKTPGAVAGNELIQVQKQRVRQRRLCRAARQQWKRHQPA